MGFTALACLGIVWMAALPGETTRRLFKWMAFSAVVGLVGEVAISQVVSEPITQLVAAARRIGQGELVVCVRARQPGDGG